MNIDLMCKYQADLFAYACEKKDCSSSIFIKQFAYSNLAKRMDDEAYIYSADDITKAYYSLTLEKKLNKGKQIYPLKIMSWIGYIMRYISYKYKYSTNYIYKKVKPLKKIHKPLGYITAALTLFHIFECNKYKFHNKNNTKINRHQ